MADELSQLESARLAIARVARSSDPELVRSLHQLARVTAATLGVDRVGIWSIEDSWQRLRCVASVDLRSEGSGAGTVLNLASFPAYARALSERRVIAAEDAQKDPRTRELTDSYLAPNDIRAMLDCPIYEDGSVVAIVCHECVGKTRAWNKRDSDFAVSVADVASTLFAQVARIRFEGELRATREELAQARVMDSLGRMATGVAHDINNLLMGVSLAIGVLEDAAGADVAAHEAAADARSLIDQGAKLVKTLLTFSRQSAYGGRPVEVNGHIRDMLPRMKTLLGADVTLEASLAAAPAYVGMDAPVLGQILLNLIVNARDAMPGGGGITVQSMLAGDHVVISVRDTGVGMDGATRQRVFEPFFSTKAGAGTGLGLAIVFGAVRAARGSVDVESQPGTGSTFTVRLPLSDAGSTPPSGSTWVG